MDSNNTTPQYQRAVTPTVDNGTSHNSILSRGTGKLTGNAISSLNTIGTASNISSAPNSARRASSRNNDSINNNGNNNVSVNGSGIPNPGSIRGSKLTNHRTIIPANNNFHLENTGITNSKSSKSGGIADINSNGSNNNSSGFSNSMSSILPRFDLILLTDEIPSDKILFARVRNFPDTLVCFRTPEERAANPERLNLDRRQLDVCPLLEQESRLRLLNYQNNNIRHIRNLENLPNLIFLDMYNNKLSSLEGPVSGIVGLRVLMAGKNRITNISNLNTLKKLDVLDLHSNDIREIEGLDSLSELRVLNLAGNKISYVKNMSNLQALTELNLRRNCIKVVTELDRLPALQRIFLSHNLISSYNDINSIFHVKYLIELSLDGNPISDPNFVPGPGPGPGPGAGPGAGAGAGVSGSSGSIKGGDSNSNSNGLPSSPQTNSIAVTNRKYRSYLIELMPSLRHLDLKAVTPEEREAIAATLTTAAGTPGTSGIHGQQGHGLGKTPLAQLLSNGVTVGEMPPPLPDADADRYVKVEQQVVGNTSGTGSNSSTSSSSSSSSSSSNGNGNHLSNSMKRPSSSGHTRTSSPYSVSASASADAADGNNGNNMEKLLNRSKEFLSESSEVDNKSDPNVTVIDTNTTTTTIITDTAGNGSNNSNNNYNARDNNSSRNTNSPLGIMTSKLNNIKELNHQHLSLNLNLSGNNNNMDAESQSIDEKLLNAPVYRLITGNHNNNNSSQQYPGGAGGVAGGTTTSHDMALKLFGPSYGGNGNGSGNGIGLLSSSSAAGGGGAGADKHHVAEIFEFESFAKTQGPSEKVLYMQGEVFNEGMSSCSWYVNSNKGKLLSAVTKAYFNKVSLHTLCSRAIHASSSNNSNSNSGGISYNAGTGSGTGTGTGTGGAGGIWFNMFSFLQNSCKWMKFTQNTLESLQDVYKLSECMTHVGTSKSTASMALEHLYLSHNAICDLSPNLLRPFIIALFCPSTLLTLNDLVISKEERAHAENIYSYICYSVIPTALSNQQHQGQVQAQTQAQAQVQQLQLQNARDKNGRDRDKDNRDNFAGSSSSSSVAAAAASLSVPIIISSTGGKKGSKLQGGTGAIGGTVSNPSNSNIQNILLSAANAIAYRRTKVLFDAQFSSSVHEVMRQTISEMQEYDYD